MLIVLGVDNVTVDGPISAVFSGQRYLLIPETFKPHPLVQQTVLRWPEAAGPVEDVQREQAHGLVSPFDGGHSSPMWCVISGEALLVQHMEQKSAQVVAAQEAHTRASEANYQCELIVYAYTSRLCSGADAAADSSDLQGVASFLRKEEIADLQLEVNQQEISYPQVQRRASLERAQRANRILRRRANACMNTGPSAARRSLARVEHIKELNLLREWDWALRAELTAHEWHAALLKAQVQTTQAELDPVLCSCPDPSRRYFLLGKMCHSPPGCRIVQNPMEHRG
ncbi:hypothetical protein BKA62DRAFT_775134 [Auriculariales sp. MPI-PUGE-AT-0066]|nr:hypothetical protein BKA62DRAFT_775134 [Auriculariales sp. MPI-PUGE-AT-0066]